MRRAEEIIGRARACQRVREGVRAKVRFPDALAARARACAEEAGLKLGEWVNCACRSSSGCLSNDVADCEKMEVATRTDSECLTVRAPAGMRSPDILRAVRAACAFCESRRVAFAPDPSWPTRVIVKREG